jgi:hypothetical protein
MDINTLGLHPEYPEKVWIVVEQPRNEPYRLAYDRVSRTFSPTTRKVRGVPWSGVYGWIGGTGIPPEPHHDVFLATRQLAAPGDILVGQICGVFLRHDNDNKFLAVDEEMGRGMAKMDLSCLDESFYQEVLQLYPRVGEGEGWFGTDVAFAYLRRKALA